MPISVSNTVGTLLNNANSLPDGTVQTPFVQSVLAAGVSSQATATPITGEINVITNNTTTNGVILPVGVKAQRIEIWGALAVAGSIVYPPVGGTLNGAAVNAGAALASRVMRSYRCISDDGLQWIST
jgi:hypothetical protein